MPIVGGRHFPYDTAGIKAAARARSRMRIPTSDGVMLGKKVGGRVQPRVAGLGEKISSKVQAKVGGLGEAISNRVAARTSGLKDRIVNKVNSATSGLSGLADRITSKIKKPSIPKY